MRRANLWATACGREDLREKDNLYGSYRLCGAHFEVHMFLNDLRNRLQPGVIPTKFSHLNPFRRNYSNRKGRFATPNMQPRLVLFYEHTFRNGNVALYFDLVT
jgi:hypothetical protein